MKKLKNCLIFALVAIFMVSTSVYADNTAKSKGTIQQQINDEDMPDGISFTTTTELILDNGEVVIPKDSTIYAYVVGTKGERRWHRSGFALCKLKGYEPSKEVKAKTITSEPKKDIPTGINVNSQDNNSRLKYDVITLAPANNEVKEEIEKEIEEEVAVPKNTFVDIEKKDIYMVARKYEAIDKKQAAKTAAELTTTTAAGFIIPGVDIAYYFTKGMIKKKEGKTRFKSGVSTAYENSIFWFWLKGKPLDLEENASISFKEIDRDKAHDMINKMKEENNKANKNY